MNKKISVIIPVYNDSSGVKTTVSSLQNQTYSNYELVPVDNDSTDETYKVLNNLAKENTELISLHRETSIQSSYAARNTGIDNSNSDILLFLDADMWVDNTWVENMVSIIESRNCDYVGCNVELVIGDNPTLWERYEQAFSFPVETYLKDKHFAPTCALAVRREVFEEVGLFDERLESGGDEEFGQRVHRAGFKQGYAENVTAYHPARTLGMLSIRKPSASAEDGHKKTSIIQIRLIRCTQSTSSHPVRFDSGGGSLE